mgnify:CR=1 FL=1
MANLLKPGQSLTVETGGLECEVEALLGGGGQGEVYRISLGGKPFALKWYFSQQATHQQRKNLENLIRIGPPNDRFLWPESLVKAKGLPSFGYIMRLRPPTHKSLIDLMKRQVDVSFRTLTTTGLELAESFFQLHAKGLCYRDISFGNAFFDPSTGHVLVCDNDNVGVDNKSDALVEGTLGFMAPEIVTRRARPSRQTDLFSLAVLLFYLLMIHHPLEGKRESDIKCWDMPAKMKLYMTEPVFIFDPNDDSNRPVPGYHKNAIEFWPLYPQSIRNLFIRSFTEGIRDPEHGRVVETEWRSAMVLLRDSIVYCAGCGAENFYDHGALKAGGQLSACWHCKKPVDLPPRLRIAGSVIMLNHDTKLYPHHTDSSRGYDFAAPVGEVKQHPTKPQLWGLKNLSDEKWVITSADGTVKDVEPQQSLTIANGTRISFGRVEGEIRA